MALRTNTSTKPVAGAGKIALHSRDSEVIFSELSCTYPLKILALRATDRGIATAYMVSYGGGLVCGDQIALEVNIECDAKLMLLSQGSTKVFKMRPGQRASSSSETPISSTRQRLHVRIADGGALFLLPDPVTCYQAAAYHQVQTFHLIGKASVVLLDWFTSGRRSRGEEWKFAQYLSVNEVFIDGKRIARDSTHLKDESAIMNHDMPLLSRRELGDRLKPYACYATIILYGPLTQAVIQQLDEKYKQISVFKQKEPPDLIWSSSMVKADEGRTVRVAGKETELVKNWLKETLKPLEKAIGIDVYRRAFI